LSEKEVRRSERFKNKTNGFKPNSCTDRRCITCSPSLPTLSVQTLQNLGTNVGGLNLEEVSEERLAKKKIKAAAIEKKKEALKNDGAGLGGSKEAADEAA
jgi:hypothetical protein